MLTVRNDDAHLAVDWTHSREQLRRNGYTVISRLVPLDRLAELQDAVEVLIAEHEATILGAGKVVEGSSRVGVQSFMPGPLARSARLHALASGGLGWAAATLLERTVEVFWDQLAVKRGVAKVAAAPGGARSRPADGSPSCEGRFSWHQDSAYVPHRHDVYLTCFVALDPATPASGGLSISPFGAVGCELRPHRADAENCDKVVVFDGQIPGTPVPLAPGDALCFSSLTLHASGPNRAVHDRRGVLVQFRPQSPSPHLPLFDAPHFGRVGPVTEVASVAQRSATSGAGR
jgi:ectoine hydroxylase-related dioxygenase (phytanoyl-CoA dioxygenase family)